MASEMNLSVVQQQTYRLYVTLTDTDTAAAIDITGYTFYLQMRAQQASTATLVGTYGSGTGEITITDAAAGTFQFELASAVTEAFTFTTAYYDLFAVTSGGDTVRLLHGRVALSPSVTVI